MSATQTPKERSQGWKSKGINRKRPVVKGRKQTVSEQETGYTPDELRRQQQDMRQRALARFAPDYTPPEQRAVEDETEERRASRPPARGGGSAPKSSIPERTLSDDGSSGGDRLPEGRPHRALTVAPQMSSDARAHITPQRARPIPASESAPPRVCQRDGCEERLSGKQSKWCSERCRKAGQDVNRQSCVNCGLPTHYGTRNGYAERPLCRRCVKLSPEAEERYARVLEMHQQGMRNYKIAIALGVSTQMVASDLKRLRAQGKV